MIKPNRNCLKKSYSILKILAKHDLYPDFTQCSSVTAMADGGLSINTIKEGILYSVDVYNDMESTIMIKKIFHLNEILDGNSKEYIYDFKTKEELSSILNKYNEISGR